MREKGETRCGFLLIFYLAFFTEDDETYRLINILFFLLLLPMSGPILAVAAILQVTGIWNDFLFGLIFAGQSNLPMTVELNNIVNTTTGTKAYDVDMAATILTALVPLSVYLLSGRWFVRGIASGAVKG